jgi:hypothetical protein
MQLDLLSIVVGWVTASISVVAGHRLILYREREARKADLRGFLGRWLGKTKHGDVHTIYLEFCDILWGYYGKCRRDFCHQSEFRRLCDDLGSLKLEDIQKDTGGHREIITRKIEALLAFV